MTLHCSNDCERKVGKWAVRISWKAVVVTFFCFVISLYLLFILVNDRYIHHMAWYEQPAPCVTPQFIMDEMIKLTFSVSSLLTQLNISHVICYGTLWGALRQGKTLAWDNNVDFCVLRNEIQKVPWEVLRANFMARNMDISYNARHGEYIIMKGPAQAIINVFYTTVYDEVFKDGVENRFLWFFQDSPLSFPARLMEVPFNTVVFHGQQVPVPHDGIEILKYLYRENWWLEKPPVGCTTTRR